MFRSPTIPFHVLAVGRIEAGQSGVPPVPQVGPGVPEMLAAELHHHRQIELFRQAQKVAQPLGNPRPRMLEIVKHGGNAQPQSRRGNGRPQRGDRAKAIAVDFVSRIQIDQQELLREPGGRRLLAPGWGVAKKQHSSHTDQ